MNNELLSILSYLERDRGIDREVLIQAVEYALQSAARKTMGGTEDVRVEIDRKTCDIRAFATMRVVEKKSREQDTIALEDALKTNPDASLDDFIEVEVAAKDFGRIAAQTAKQAILQKIRQAERDNVYDEYKDRIGDIVSGSVHQFNRCDIVVRVDDVVAGLTDNGEAVVCLDGKTPSATPAVLWTYPAGDGVWDMEILPDITGDGIDEVLAAVWSLGGSAVRCINGATTPWLACEAAIRESGFATTGRSLNVLPHPVRKWV